MSIAFIPMDTSHAVGVMDIFNYYIENSFAAFLEDRLPLEFYKSLLQMSNNYPRYVMWDDECQCIVGFCLLKPFHPGPVFKGTAEITSFIHPDYVGKGLGRKALQHLEEAVRALNITKIIASISSLNDTSLKFHKAVGFKECGCLPGIGRKQGRLFDVVWMIKEI